MLPWLDGTEEAAAASEPGGREPEKLHAGAERQEPPCTASDGYRLARAVSAVPAEYRQPVVVLPAVEQYERLKTLDAL